MSEDVDDLVKFDEVMQKSGAILSRNKKSKWRGKQNWPEQVKWMKVVTEIKIFGFILRGRHTVSKSFPLHQYKLDTFMESLGRG